MTFDFQKIKPVIQAEFDAVMMHYPTPLREVKEKVPVGGDPWVRKMALLEAAAEKCPVHIFPHYPFAFEADCGQKREYSDYGLGTLCRDRSGADFGPLYAFRELLYRNELGTFNDYTDYLHRAVDYDSLLTEGFSGVYGRCVKLNRTETDPEKKTYRETLMRVCRLAEKVGLRLKKQAAELLETETDPEGIYNLRRIVFSANTPWDRAETFYDALNSLLCIALLVSEFDGVAMNCLGAIDRLLWPYYEKDLAEGRITEEEGAFLLRCFLFKTDAHAHYNEERTNYDNGVTIMIGGCDPDGNPVYNPLTDMILEAYRENRFIQPKLNARAGAYSPEAYLTKLAEHMLAGGNNIIVENDDYIVPMFQRMGLSAEDARCYIGGGCQEVIGKNHIHSRAFTYLNLPQILLDTLDHACRGRPLSEDHRMIYRYGSFRGESFEALRTSFLANLRSCIRVIAEQFAPYERIHHTINPEPVLSCFTADCVTEGKDTTAGGARYYHKTLSLVGFGTLCDSLLSLRDACQTGTAETLLAAMKADFEGYEPLRQSLLSSVNRFGHNEKADDFANELAQDLSAVSAGIYNPDGIEWHTSLFTYYLFYNFGCGTGATPDGRKRGEPLSRQMNMAKLPELTTAARSLSRICDVPFDDVGMFDIALPMGEGDGYVKALAAYIRTCIGLKIPVLQTNLADRQMLAEERAEKGTHPELIVRVCGYSACFTRLSGAVQDEIIARLDN